MWDDTHHPEWNSTSLSLDGDGLIINDVTQVNLFVRYLVKQMILKSINILKVVFASNAGSVFTFVVM